MNKELSKLIDELIEVEADLGNMTMVMALALRERQREGVSEDEMRTISVYSKGYADAVNYAFDKIKSVLDPYLEDEPEEEKEVKEES